MRPRITLTNAVGLTRVTSNRRVNQSSRIFLLTRPGFIEVDAASRNQSSIAGRIKLRNTLPPLASNDLMGTRRFNAPTHHIDDVFRMSTDNRNLGYKFVFRD